MNKPLVNEINFFQDQQHQQPLSTATPKRSTTSGKVLNLPIIDEPIDHNLIEALQKPTERTNALKIEQTIYNFVYSE